MHNVIFINAEPHSGKDTVARMIHKNTPLLPVMEKAAKPLYEAIGALFSLTPSEWASIYENAKEEPCEAIWEMTPREAMIWLSEEVSKPLFGDEFFGRLLGKRIIRQTEERDTVFVVSDAGFVDEVKACIDMLDETYRIDLIRVIRKGTSFHGDSRMLVDKDDIGIPSECFHVIENNGTLVELEENVRSVMKRMGVLW